MAMLRSQYPHPARALSLVCVSVVICPPCRTVIASSQVHALLARMLITLLTLAATDAGIKEIRMERLLQNFIKLYNQEWSTLSERPAFVHMAECAHVAPSKTHGLGLFAREDLDDGTLVSLYPVDALGHADGYLTHGKANREHFAGSEKQRLQTFGWYRVSLSHPSVLRWAKDLWVDANPTLPSRLGWLGHYANDASMIARGSDVDEEAILTYYAAAHELSNCVLIPVGDAAPLLGVVSTRPIARGKELLLSYGHEYWLPNHLPSSAVRQAANRVFVPRSIQAQSKLRERYREEVGLLERLLELDRVTRVATSAEAP